MGKLFGIGIGGIGDGRLEDCCWLLGPAGGGDDAEERKAETGSGAAEAAAAQEARPLHRQQHRQVRTDTSSSTKIIDCQIAKSS